MIASEQLLTFALPPVPEGAAWFGWVVAIGTCTGWIIDNRRKAVEVAKLQAESDKLVSETDKLKAEVYKLQADQVKLAGDTLKEVQRTRDAYADACVECTKACQAIIAALPSRNPSLIATSRNAFCEALTRRGIQSYCALVEWECLNRKLTPAVLQSYILNDVIAEIHQLTEWVETINHPMFREGYQAEPLEISERALRPLLEAYRHLPDEEGFAVRPALKSATDKLMGA